ncbi:MAG: peptidylprolyl isomerase [Coriobacteriia bacterium]|nr:peptidylprolyl isomerase [Coriobacteriia bacterium]
MRAIYVVLLPLALVILLVGAVVALPGCSSQVKESAPTPPPADTPVDQAETDSPAPEEESLYTAEYTPDGTEAAVITTSKGVIKFEFYPEDAPNTVAAFIERAEEGFYDGTKFHRVEPGFVIQGGDPLSKTDDPMVGTGGPGYQLRAEFNDRSHLDGTVAMARSQNPDSAGSQFYICLGPQPFLDGQYTVFGQVVEGMDVVRQIAVGDAMESVRIERSE